MTDPIKLSDSNTIDDHVAGRIRMRRLIAGMSQEQLSKALGITSQQVQKYENGKNRVSASRLYDLSKVLGVSVSFFFEGLGGADAPAAHGGSPHANANDGGGTEEFLRTREAIELSRAYLRIESPKSRRAVEGLVHAMAEQDC